ncbi:MAG: sensor histidine kinase, partial [Bacillota bacterium]
INSVVLINDTNSSIHQNIVEYKNLREDFSENKTKLKKTKNKMDLISKLSHEFKTPLNLIFSSVQMLKLYNKNNSEESSKNEERNKIDKYTEIISQNSYRMLRLVNNLIDLVKIDVNSYNLNFKNIDIVKLVKNTTDSVRDYIDHKKRKINFNSKIEKRIIKCDPVNIERVLLNLLSNAVKFTNKGDKIVIELTEKEGMIVISVIDFGVGMKKEELKYIFDEFNQIDDTLSKNSEGSGLGLSIVKAIIEKHNGDIQVESEFGKGTKFSIFLPDKKLEDEEAVENIYDENSDLNRTALELSDL